MGTTRVLLGFAGALVVTIGWALAGIAAGRAWAGDVPAPLRHAVYGVLALVGLLLTSALLGTLGRFDTVPLLGVAAVAGVAAILDLRSRPRRGRPSRPLAAIPRLDLRLLTGAAALLAVRWGAEVLQTLGRGFSHADELHYHLTHSALFVQSGETWPIRFTSVGDGAAYHPAHSELLHAVGMAVMGSDFLSVFLNIAFAALAVAAGWAIGERAGNPGAGALVVAAVLSLPLVVSESGSTLNDTMAIALLLVAVALLLEAIGRGGSLRLMSLAGIAAGAAVGTKLTVVVAVGGLLLLLLALPRARRASAGGAFVGSGLLAGGYWYLRNLVHTGNPVPALSFGPLPGPELALQRAVEFPVLDYLFDVDIWRDWFVPGLADFFGPMWPVLPGLTIIAALAGLVTWRQDRRWALLAAAGLLGLVGYVATPTSAAGTPGEPSLFQFNLRYALPGLLLCVLAGLAHPALRRRPALGTALAGTAFLVANLHVVNGRRGLAALAGVVVVAGAVWVGGRLPHYRTTAVVGGIAVIALGLLVSVRLHDRYLERRWTSDLDRWSAYAAGDQASGLAIGVTGYPQSYPFFGVELDNRVVTLADDVADDELLPHTSCADWWTTVEAAELDVVVVLDEAIFNRTDVGRWLVHEPRRWLRASGAPVLLEERSATVFHVRDATPSCASTLALDARRLPLEDGGLADP